MGDLDLEEQWTIFWFGLRSVVLLILVDILFAVVGLIIQPSKQTVFLGAIVVFAGNIVVLLWTLNRLISERREQLEKKFFE